MYLNYILSKFSLISYKHTSITEVYFFAVVHSDLAYIYYDNKITNTNLQKPAWLEN